MTTLNEGKTPGDWLHYEADAHYSRDAVTFAAGALIESGTVVGQVTATKKFVPCVETATDGSQVARGICLTKVYADTVDRPGVVVSSHATVHRAGLTFDASFDTTAKRDAAMAELLSNGIKSA